MSFGIMKKIPFIYALSASILIQVPLFYLFISPESLAFGHGFIGAPNDIMLYLLWVLLVATFIILVIGLPIYFFLKYYSLNTALNVALVGFLIPVIILSIITFSTASYEGFSAGENYYGTYRSIVIDGKRTFWGWVKVFEAMLTYGIHGFLGAIIFHKIYLRGKMPNK